MALRRVPTQHGSLVYACYSVCVFVAAAFLRHLSIMLPKTAEVILQREADGASQPGRGSRGRLQHNLLVQSGLTQLSPRTSDWTESTC